MFVERNVARLFSALALSLALAAVAGGAGGCVFAPELGDGDLHCGGDGLCPSGYRCAADLRCYPNDGPPDLAGADLAGIGLDQSVPGDDLGGGDMAHGGGDLAHGSADLSCIPTVGCGAYCGTIADDGCGHALRCDCARPDTCSAQTANSCACTPIASCNAAHAHCGMISDGCGGVLDCGNCSGQQVCGDAPQPYTCGNQTPCTPTACQKGQCGTIDDQCTGVVDCGDCPAGQVCGGGGVAHFCG